MHFFEDIKSLLKEKDYKITPQRKIIINAFLDNKNRHLSAEEVFQIVKFNNLDIGLATVYRTLDLFEELGILKKIDFGDGRFRFELIEKNEQHHHHLICLNCERVIEFEDELLESLESVIIKKTGFKVIDHQLKFYGYCQKCLKKENKD